MSFLSSFAKIVINSTPDYQYTTQQTWSYFKAPNHCAKFHQNRTKLDCTSMQWHTDASDFIIFSMLCYSSGTDDLKLETTCCIQLIACDGLNTDNEIGWRTCCATWHRSGPKSAMRWCGAWTMPIVRRRWWIALRNRCQSYRLPSLRRSVPNWLQYLHNRSLSSPVSERRRRRIRNVTHFYLPPGGVCHQALLRPLCYII